MRVTNTMITNRMLVNINKNVRQVNNLYGQLSTGKKLTYPSDNPILASRALKFRTNVTETAQYQRNVSQGLSWMELTEASAKNVNSIYTRLRELAVQGASDENTYEDRQKIAEDMAQLIKQLGTEMNATYAGRYVFSGLRTDEAPTFETDQPDLKYSIVQDFVGSDIEVVKTYQRVGADIVSNDDVCIIKLPYENIDENTFQFITVASIDPNHTTDYDPDAYSTPPDSIIKFIPETSELVLPKDIADAMKSGSTLRLHYEKHGFEAGDINPKVYFECADLDTGNEYDMENQDLEFEFGVNTRIAINAFAKDVCTANMFADLNNFVKLMQDIRISTKEELEAAGSTQIDQQILREESLAKDIMRGRFNNLIGILDKHTAATTKEHTDLGSRMNRLELIESRLADDSLNYQKLLSENEDADYMSLIMGLNSAESVYQASLQTGAKIVQLSLANFL